MQLFVPRMEDDQFFRPISNYDNDFTQVFSSDHGIFANSCGRRHILFREQLFACYRTTEQERDAITWIRWLVQEVGHFERSVRG